MVSFAIDAMAMNPGNNTMPAEPSNHLIVFSVQPLDRRNRCWPLDGMHHPSGRATDDVHAATDPQYEALANNALPVRFVGADEDAGYNNSRQTFFAEWYADFVGSSLEAAVSYVVG
jgi:hypothetical protein